MKITRFEAFILRAPDTGRPHWVSNFIVPRANEILVRLSTDEGVEGFGIATSYTPIEAAIHALKSGIGEHIVGADPTAPERLYQKLFALTWQRLAHEKGWSREAMIRIAAATDIACWDIIGKAANLPLYSLFGGFRDKVPCYVTCAYYRDGKTMSELKDEMQMLKAQGHRGFKAKAGGLPLGEDIPRLELVREVIGWDNDLMVDVNRGWDLDTAIEGARLHRAVEAALAGRAGALGRRPARAQAAFERDPHPALGGRERTDQLGLPRAAGGGGDPDPAVRLHHVGRLHRREEARRAVRAQPRPGRAAPRLLHPLPHRRRQPRGRDRRVVHRPRARPAAGRAVRAPAEDRRRLADPEPGAGPRPHAVAEKALAKFGEKVL